MDGLEEVCDHPRDIERELNPENLGNSAILLLMELFLETLKSEKKSKVGAEDADLHQVRWIPWKERCLRGNGGKHDGCPRHVRT